MTGLPGSLRADVEARPLLPAVARIVTRDGTPLPLGPRTALLVALVAIGIADERALLASLLYPRLAAAAARRNLRQLLHKQREVLGDAIEQRGDRLYLRAGVRVSVEPGQSCGARRDEARQSLLALASLLGEEPGPRA